MLLFYSENLLGFYLYELQMQPGNVYLDLQQTK